MNTRRWIELVLVLLLGIAIGYSVAPSARYTFIVGRARESYDALYRCDTHTGKTWWSVPGVEWEEVGETNKVLPLPKK